MPDVAILDAAVTEGVPPNVTAMTGIRCADACDWEAYSALQRRRFTDSGGGAIAAMIENRCRKPWVTATSGGA